MSNRHHKQTDFSGGEISTRMWMRADTALYQKSVWQMQNMMPTLQGTVERTPGSRFIEELGTGDDEARIIPYLSSANKRAIVVIKEGSIEVKEGILDELTPQVSVMGARSAAAPVPIRRQIVVNPDLTQSAEPWVLDPIEYTGGAGDTLGLTWQNIGTVDGTARNWKSRDIDTCTISATAEVDYPTDVITVDFRAEYRDNFSAPDAPYSCFLRIGTSPNGNNVMNYEIKGQPGTIAERLLNFSLPTTQWTGTLYLTMEWKALTNADHNVSSPRFRLDRWLVWQDDEIEIPDGTVPEPGPYLKEELKDLHFVQSPYGPPIDDPLMASKPLVVTHPKHPPHWLYFNVDDTDLPLGYRFVPIPFVRQPVQWGIGNYPATCTSFNGRLILAGALLATSTPGDPFPEDSETVWGTEVGRWNTFSAEAQVDPDDSIEFTAIYRSPIQWVYGQKNLLVGALEMEYVAYADGIFSPGDLGVEMQSTHGSRNVQPAGFGEVVLYPAESGTRVRAMAADQLTQGWISPDLTLYHPELCSTGVVRMVRMRNPHQMLIAVLGSGELALLHMDTQAQVSGWSRINLGASVKDACVLANDRGEDVLFVTTRRFVNGAWRLYLEAIPNWTTNNEWDYMSSSSFKQLAPETNVITGLEHLEGQTIQVVGDYNYLGSFVVTGGQVTLLDEIGEPINVTYFLGGILMRSTLALLPPNAEDPGSAKRYSDISVRTRGSTRPIINGERPRDRAPLTNMDNSQPLDLITDLQVANMGWDLYSTITIEEDIPLRLEVLGVYGKLTTNSL